MIAFEKLNGRCGNSRTPGASAKSALRGRSATRHASCHKAFCRASAAIAKATWWRENRKLDACSNWSLKVHNIRGTLLQELFVERHDHAETA